MEAPVPGLERYAGKTVGILGLARSGLATARALTAAGAEVRAWDDRGDVVAAAGLTRGRDDDLKGLAALVVSPGVPLTHPAPHPIVVGARALSVPITADVQLFVAGLEPGQRVVGVTGTNGKSTTSALIHHLLRAAGLNAALGGNIGRAVFDLGPLSEDAIVVLELSSFQLDLCTDLKVDVAVFLNLAPDHLDRHGDVEGYLGAKRKLLDQQGPEAAAVVGVDDPHGRAIHADLLSTGRRVRAISGAGPVVAGAYVQDGRLYEVADGTTIEIADLRGAKGLRGAHNGQNAAAAYAALRALGVAPEAAARGLAAFAGLPHRMEEVARHGRVAFVNDSKATNPDAAIRSLTSYDPVVWIAGGRAKPGGFKDLAPYLGAVRAAFLIGEAADAIAPRPRRPRPLHARRHAGAGGCGRARRRRRHR